MNAASNSAPQLHSVPTASKLLGGISERTVWRYISEGVLKPVRLGGRTMLRDDDLARLIEQATEKPALIT